MQRCCHEKMSVKVLLLLCRLRRPIPPRGQTVGWGEAAAINHTVRQQGSREEHRHVKAIHSKRPGAAQEEFTAPVIN